MMEKLHKILARSGVGSRREVERWIREKRILVNNRIAQLGERVSCTDQVFYAGKPIHLKVPTLKHQRRVLVYYKSEGEICTRADPENRPTVFSGLAPLRGRWLMVGRLDINSLGLLLFTNDGELVYRLSHPSYQIEREYSVRVFGKVDESLLRRLKTGVALEEGMASFTRIVKQGRSKSLNQWYRVVLTEGRHREVRRLWESQKGIKVSRLIRIRFGSVVLPENLRKKQWYELNPKEITKLASSVGL